MFDLGAPAWEIVVRSGLVYLALLVGLRAHGQTRAGPNDVFDLVVVLLIANSVQNAMVGPDFSLQGGVLAAFVLLALNWGVGALRMQGGPWGRVIESTPTVLVQDGRFLEAHLRRERIEPTEVEMAVREHGLESISSVKLAVLETDGSISIVPMDARVIKSHRKFRQLRKR